MSNLKLESTLLYTPVQPRQSQTCGVKAVHCSATVTVTKLWDEVSRAVCEGSSDSAASPSGDGAPEGHLGGHSAVEWGHQEPVQAQGAFLNCSAPSAWKADHLPLVHVRLLCPTQHARPSEFRVQALT